MDSEVFVKLSPTKLFFRCAVPALITSVFGALYSVVDGIFVGRYLGENALAAINLVMPVIMIVEAVSNMIATGASVSISILLGEKKREEASRCFSFSVVFIVLFSAAAGILGLLFAKPFISLIAPDADGKTVLSAVKYLKVFAAFGPLIPVYFAVDNYLRACGKEKLSMIFGVASQFLNVVLDYLLIAVFHKGIEAAALASCVSIALGSVVMLALFLKKRFDLCYTRPVLRFRQFRHILANGSSEFFSSISMSVMSIIMNLFLLQYGGTVAVAAFSVVMYVDSIIGMLSFGICDSLQPAISYCYGAGEMERMKSIFRHVLFSMVVVSLAAFLFMLLAGPFVAPFFIKPEETELEKVSISAIKIFSFSYLVGWIDMCFSSFFTALDRPGRSFLVSLFGTLLFPVAFLFILTPLFGLNGVWWMPSVSAVASGALTLALARTLRI